MEISGTHIEPFIIRTNEHGCQLIEIKTYGPGEKEGQSYEKIHGYYSNPESAILKAVKLKVLSKESITVVEYLKEVQKSYDELRKILL